MKSLTSDKLTKNTIEKALNPYMYRCHKNTKHTAPLQHEAKDTSNLNTKPRVFSFNQFRQCAKKQRSGKTPPNPISTAPSRHPLPFHNSKPNDTRELRRCRPEYATLRIMRCVGPTPQPNVSSGRFRIKKLSQAPRLAPLRTSFSACTPWQRARSNPRIKRFSCNFIDGNEEAVIVVDCNLSFDRHGSQKTLNKSPPPPFNQIGNRLSH